MYRALALVCFAAVLGGVLFVDGAAAEDKHLKGKEKLGKKIDKDGKYELEKVGPHTVHAVVVKKQVKEVTVTNAPVKKFKTAKKVVQGQFGNDYHFVMAEAEPQAVATLFVAWAFTDGVHWYYYWFDVAFVVGRDAGFDHVY
jgi:hypothetical protein